MKSEFLSGAADRQQKIEAAIRKLLGHGWAIIEIEVLEADLQQAAEAANV